MTLSPNEASAVLALKASRSSLLRTRTAMRKLSDAEGADAITELVDAVNCLIVTLTGQERVSAVEVTS